jgi:hypothetical protein
LDLSLFKILYKVAQKHNGDTIVYRVTASAFKVNVTHSYLLDLNETDIHISELSVMRENFLADYFFKVNDRYYIVINPLQMTSMLERIPNNDPYLSTLVYNYNIFDKENTLRYSDIMENHKELTAQRENIVPSYVLWGIQCYKKRFDDNKSLHLSALYFMHVDSSNTQRAYCYLGKKHIRAGITRFIDVLNCSDIAVTNCHSSDKISLLQNLLEAELPSKPLYLDLSRVVEAHRTSLSWFFPNIIKAYFEGGAEFVDGWEDDYSESWSSEDYTFVDDMEQKTYKKLSAIRKIFVKMLSESIQASIYYTLPYETTLLMEKSISYKLHKINNGSKSYVNNMRPGILYRGDKESYIYDAYDLVCARHEAKTDIKNSPPIASWINDRYDYEHSGNIRCVLDNTVVCKRQLRDIRPVAIASKLFISMQDGIYGITSENGLYGTRTAALELYRIPDIEHILHSSNPSDFKSGGKISLSKSTRVISTTCDPELYLTDDEKNKLGEGYQLTIYTWYDKLKDAYSRDGAKHGNKYNGFLSLFCDKVRN